ncbi:MAG: hypothetical protein NC307_03840 [Roseburia sp.]|nr:hypothetical protein [Roseburia sp.]
MPLAALLAVSAGCDSVSDMTGEETKDSVIEEYSSVQEEDMSVNEEAAPAPGSGYKYQAEETVEEDLSDSGTKDKISYQVIEEDSGLWIVFILWMFWRGMALWRLLSLMRG